MHIYIFDIAIDIGFWLLFQDIPDMLSDKLKYFLQKLG